MAIAYFSTWTTYGTWLHGDPRGSFLRGGGSHAPDPVAHRESLAELAEAPLVLDADQRRLVEQTIADHCAVRKWQLHAVNCRSNHVHVVVTARGRPIEQPREQFKSWCTRRLKAASEVVRERWWTERGWDEYIDDDRALAEVIAYVLDGQDTR
ncbi:transposase [Urbifossiella limnaea]|uniref:Transposase IS200 like protein n=1 Tax=Urbifossiella limnaea TaxID=2528023 RepID=A0A517XN37_9BACT|nr:transposase [Urbifossiella limnaea]QDU18921.1 Transposase IS200 like protein [Urbifossiella limnaea]